MLRTNALVDLRGQITRSMILDEILERLICIYICNIQGK